MEKRKKQTARGLALVVLGAIFEQGAYSNIALNQHLTNCSLTEADKHLVTELVYGTVSRKLTLEWYLSHFIADREKLEPWLYQLLMLSVYQLVYLDRIPPHAVVHEAVNLAKRGRGSDKLVNAVLRKILREGLPNPDQIKRENKRYAIQYSLPVWLVQALIAEYGRDRARAIFQSLQRRNKASVRVTNPQHFEVLQTSLQAQVSLLSPVGLTKESGHFAASIAFQQGQLAIQDETSQLVAPLFQLKGAELVLDACAAPGGKTCHLASYLNSGRVVALDLYDHKLALIAENAQRLGVADRVETKRLDALEIATVFPEESFDAILVDAPCSGIGLIRRKPDIRYNKASMDFTSLADLQLQILDRVCLRVKKGGLLTYSTCTIVSKENQEVVARFLDTHPQFEQVRLEHSVPEIMVDGCLLITPEQFGTDGFFISQFRRIA